MSLFGKLGFVAGAGKFIYGGIAAVFIGMALSIWLLSGKLSDRTAERDELDRLVTVINQSVSSAAGVVDSRGRPALLARDQIALQASNTGAKAERLAAAVADQNADIIRRSVEHESKSAEFKERLAASKRQFESARRSIERLREIASRPSDGRCEADSELLRELEGI